jgi:uncharacterized protein with GYD domain
MAKFLMLGSYSAEAIKSMSADRTKKIKGVIEKNGGKAESMFTLLGNFDLAFVVDLPGTKEATKASVEITKMSGISFKTYPALAVDEFDKLVS